MSQDIEAEPQQLGGARSDFISCKRKRKAVGISKTTHKKFKRGPDVHIGSISDKKLRGQVKHAEKVGKKALQEAKRVYEWLTPAAGGALEPEGLEKTWQFKQSDIVQAVDEGAARKAFDLALPQLGPYNVSFTRSGKWLAIAGEKGHVGLMDWNNAHLACEVQVRERTHYICMLHNEQFFAAAQRKYVYIYDRRGIEVHCCKESTEPYVLEFLPHHFLLTSCGEHGILRYQDTTHGEIIAQHRSRMGPVHAMTQNPWNAVINLGHVNGRVTMWTPNMTTPVVSLQCHLGPVRTLSVDPTGRYMATAGVDKQVHIWDLRNTYQRVHSYFSYAPASDVDISQRGMLAVAFNSCVQVWKNALATKQKACYLQHRTEGSAIQSVRFCPYEDVLAVGHAGGVSTLLVPGAGEPNFDSFVANPYQTAKERREQEVHQLLDKLQPDMIVLDPTKIAAVLKVPREVQKERAAEAKAANLERSKVAHAKNDSKTKMKGKNRGTKKHRKKQDNVIEDKKSDIKDRMQQQERERLREKRVQEAAKLKEKLESVPTALHRFYKRANR